MKKHTWIMVLCCLIPLAAILVLPYMGISLPGWTVYLIFLLCPLSHVLLMGTMGHDHHEETVHEGHHPEIVEERVPEELKEK